MVAGKEDSMKCLWSLRRAELGGYIRQWRESILWGSREILGKSSWARGSCAACPRKSEGVCGSRFILNPKTLTTQKGYQLPAHTHTPKGHSGKTPIFGSFLKYRMHLSQLASPLSLCTNSQSPLLGPIFWECGKGSFWTRLVPEPWAQLASSS